MVVKGAVIFNKEQKLLNFPRDTPLQEVVEKYCEDNGIPNGRKYAFKIINNKNSNIERSYLTDENKSSLADGYLLELVFALDYLTKKIFTKLRTDDFYSLPPDHTERKKIFDDLYNLATDPAFIKYLVEKNIHGNVLQIMQKRHLLGSEASACLVTFLHLLKMKAITTIEYDPFNYLLHLATNDCNFTDVPLAYAVLSQILYQKNTEFKIPKESIIKKLSITKLLQKLIINKNNKDLEINTLQLINAMVSAVQGEARTELIKEMKLKANRNVIKDCILAKGDIKRNLARELYLYQTFILSVHKEALNFNVDPLMDKNFKDAYEAEVVPRSSTIFDFDSTGVMKRSNSQDTILSNEDYRISLASNKTLLSIGSIYSDDLAEERISSLAMECLMHYQKHYYKNYCQSLKEEVIYNCTIFTTADRITKMLCKIFRIGKEPERNSLNYQPLIFNTEYKYDFFPEFFSRTMWLLSKTRREMKATIQTDNDKVMKIIKKQIEMILAEKPKCYTQLEMVMKKTNYAIVSQQLEKEYEQDMKRLIATNPCIKELKKHFQKINEKIIYKQKIMIMQSGQSFQKLPSGKKKEQFVKYELSNNRKIIYYCDWDNHIKKPIGPKNFFNISDIRHIMTGQVCPHVKEGWVKDKEIAQAFTIKIDGDVNYNFFAPDEKIASNWIDGFNLLLNKSNRTENYQKDLDTLIEMDCMLQLMELQNIKIPSVAPPIPETPEIVKPPIPPRPTVLLRKHNQKNGSTQNINNTTDESFI